ncbi:MAG: nicotinate-nucleotide adenylyltransferase [Gemmataceae bacterium]
MRIGIFGGTFDPVHLGHLIIAEQCREQARLDQVLFVPSARPPHKQTDDITPFDKRAEMIRLAIAGNPMFRVEELEKDRPGPSFTVDTLTELHQRQPADELHLIVGSDCLPDLPSWREPARILGLAKLIVAVRPGWPVWPQEQLRAALRLPAEELVHEQIVTLPLIDIASRDLRRRFSEGRSGRYFVPHAVLAYIADKGLYRK